MTQDWPFQHGFDLRFDWGPAGVERLAPHVTSLVIVDVLRFTSTVETACAAGIAVFPYRWRDASAADFSGSVGALLGGAGEDAPSLSPASMLKLVPGTKVVLPSPNGATCSVLAADAGAAVAAGCLRNAAAVARWLSTRQPPVAVIACGEVWRDGSLRPALEDMLGAGAILSRVPGSRSPEADAAVAAFEACASRIGSVLRSCASGRELEWRGADPDVDWCARLDVSGTVPVLSGGAFVSAT